MRLCLLVLALASVAWSATTETTTEDSFTTAGGTTAGDGGTTGSGGDGGCAGWPGLDEFCQDKENGNYPYPCNCRKYVECEEAPKNILWLCEEDWLYNEVQDYCDTPDRVDCGERPVCNEDDLECVDWHISTEPPPTYCMEEEVDSSLWLDCSEEPEGTVFTVAPCSNEYCTCTTGYEYPIKNSCDPPLVWNVAISGCDRCENVPTCTGDEPICNA